MVSYILIAIALIIIAAAMVILHRHIKSLKSRLKVLLADQAKLVEQLDRSRFVNDTLSGHLATALVERDYAHRNIEMLLSSDLHQNTFDDVEVEIGLHGVIYQFRKLDLTTQT